MTQWDKEKTIDCGVQFSAEMMSRLLLGVVLLSAVFLSTSSTSDIYSITLKDIEGNNVSMEDYRGKACSLYTYTVGENCHQLDTHWTPTSLVQGKWIL